MNFRIAARVVSQLGAELISSDEIAIYELVKNGFDAGSDVVEININYKVHTRFIKKLQRTAVERQSTSSDNVSFLNDLISDLQREIQKLKSSSEFYCKMTEKQVEEYATSLSRARTCRELVKLLGQVNSIEIIDHGHGMTAEEVERYYFTIGTTHRLKQVERLDAQDNSVKPPAGEKGIGRLSAMRLGHNLEMITVCESSPDETYVYINWRDFCLANEAEAGEIPVEVETRPKQTTRPGTYISISDLSSDWPQAKAERLATHHLAKFIDPFDPGRCPQTVSLRWNNIPIKTRELIRRYLENCQSSMKCRASITKGRAELKTTFVLGKIETNPKREFTRTYTIADFGKLTDGMFEEIGPFEMEVYHFPRNRLRAIPGFASRAEVRKWLNMWCGGLMLFRDGVRVMPYGSEGDDWLNLDAKSLRGKGFRLNRLQTVGCVRISRLGNPNLIDQTNREGLRETEAFRNFHRVLERHIQDNFVSEIAHHFSKEKADIDHLVQQVTEEHDYLQQCVDNLDVAMKRRDWKTALSVNAELSKIVKEFQDLNDSVEVVLAEKRTNQMQVLELAATGMAAEAIAHDLEGVIETALATLNEFSSLSSVGKRVSSSVRHIRSVHQAMLKQLDHISPGPAKARRRAATFDLESLVEEARDFYEARMQRQNIVFCLESAGAKFLVRAVSGHVRQILDNLFRNSLYWLLDTKTKFPHSPQSSVKVTLDGKSVCMAFSDSGIGISRDDVDWVFEAFNTRQPNGRGLGLYICRELAAFNGITIEVDKTQPNQWGRYNTFNLHFPNES